MLSSHYCTSRGALNKGRQVRKIKKIYRDCFELRQTGWIWWTSLMVRDNKLSTLHAERV